MKDTHLSDEEIQQYISGDIPEITGLEHLQYCTQCQARLATYHALFDELEKMPASVFDFDLSETVLSRLSRPVPQLSRRSRMTNILMVMGVLFAGIIIYILRDYLTKDNWVMVLLVVIATVPVLLFLAAGSIIQYRKKLAKLDFTG